MGSQRLKKKNLREIQGVALIVHAIRKCKAVNYFDEIWVNSEHSEFGAIAREEGVFFHERADSLADSVATSEQYVADFLEKRECEVVFQIHSIAPLLTLRDIASFVERMNRGDLDCLLSVEDVQIECAWKESPVNFSFSEKTNSQDLDPIQRICWAVTAWRREKYLEAFNRGDCATYCGEIGFHSLNKLASHMVKTEIDLQIAASLFPLVFPYADSYESKFEAPTKR